MKTRLMLLLPLLSLLSACETPSSDTPAPVIEGREETRNIRNTREIGVSGDAIADKLDSALDANDQRMKQLQEAEDASQ